MRHARKPHFLTPLTVGNDEDLSIIVKTILSIEETVMDNVLPVFGSVPSSDGGVTGLKILIGVLGEAD